MRSTILALVLTLFSSLSFAEDTPATQEAGRAWTLGAGFVGGPMADGSVFSVGTPDIWRQTVVQSNEHQAAVRTALNLNLNWAPLYFNNAVVDTNGNFVTTSSYLSSLNLRHSVVAADNSFFVELGYGQATGTIEFTDERIDGVMVAFGAGTGIATIKLSQFITNDRADKIAGRPNVFDGTYLSLSVDFLVLSKNK